MLRTVKNVLPVVGRVRFLPAHRNFWGVPRSMELPRLMLRDIERQFEHMDSFFRLSPLTNVMHRLMPVEAIDNTCNKYKINIDVSGFKPEDIKVGLKDRVLTIEAKMEQKSEDGSRLYQEVCKTYTLPDNVELENLKSLLTNDGVLAIEAPFAVQEEMKPKEIPINRSEKSADK